MWFDRLLSSFTRFEDRTALVDGGDEYSYARLATGAAAVRRELLGASSGARAGVAVLTGRGADAVVAILGVLSAGHHYVPLSGDFPPAKLAEILQDSGVELLVAAPRGLPALRALAACEGPGPSLRQIVHVGRLAAEDATVLARLSRKVVSVDTASPGQLPARLDASDSDLAYVMYTSGSTGKSKGVAVTLGNVGAFVDWAFRTFSFGPDDRFSGHSNINFDLSVFDIFCPLLAGAALCPLVTANDLLLPGKFLKSQRISVWFSVPGVLSQLDRAGQLHPQALHPGLRYLLFCGEELPKPLAEKCRAALPEVELWNLYGPTEATVACSAHRIDEALPRQRSVPIGRPNQPGGLLVVEMDRDEPAAIGEVGRLLLSGPQLSAGYFGNPELTRARFRELVIPESAHGAPRRYYDSGDLALRDESGLFYWCGRSDFQVKIRGFRVELGEIEAAVLSAPGVLSACAVATPGPEVKVVVFFVSSQDEAAVQQELQRSCRSKLPPYMLPSRFLRQDTLRLTANGKIDRKHYMAAAQEEL